MAHNKKNRRQPLIVIKKSARPDASTGSAVNTNSDSHCARPELVEGFERSIILQQVQDERSKNNFKYKFLILSFIIVLFHTYVHADLSSLAKNDPYPVFSTLNIDDLYLLTAEQLKYKDPDWAQRKKSRVNFSISPFTQNADRGKAITNQPCPVIVGTPVPCPDVNVALGDLTGNANMLALLYGSFPAGEEAYPGTYLNTAFVQLFGMTEQAGELTNAEFLTPFGQTGAFSFPLKYRKRGVRFELDVRFWRDLGFRIQAGVSSIRQTVESRINLNDLVTPSTFQENVDTFLMEEVNNIADQIGLYIGDTNHASAEEVRFNLFWRHAFEVNEDSEYDWSHLLCIPYLEVAGSWSPGKARNPDQVFAVPFGNNHHPSAGFTAGMNFDFIETIEIGAEVSFTHFFKRNFENYPVPTSQFQRVLFPFQTDVSIQPGNNLVFGARLAAYHFVGNLSMYFEWFVLDHKKDKITLKVPDPAFLPGVLEQTTSFKTKFANFALNYDISPNIGLGFLWQIPFSQRNAYRSATLMLGINITF